MGFRKEGIRLSIWFRSNLTLRYRHCKITKEGNMAMTSTEKRDIETQALLRRADLAINNTGRLPKSLAKQIANDEGFTSGLEKMFDRMEEIIDPDEMDRLMNMSDEEFAKERAKADKALEEILNDPINQFI